MVPVRVLFAGTPEVAIPALDALLDDVRFEVVAVLTNPDRPRGRSSRPVPSPVAARAAALGLTVLRPERVRDAADAIVATGADIGAVVAYGSILPGDVLATLPHGFVNLHLSLLPRWRGAAPVQHAVRAGDAVSGVSAFRLDEGMDTGPVLRSLEVPVPDGIDAGDLLDALAEVGAPVLADALFAAVAGEPGRTQPSEGATAAPRILPADAQVDWTRPADEVSRLVRSVTPRPGAVTTLDGSRLKIAGVLPGGMDDAAASAAQGGVPGEVLGTAGDAIVVACGKGSVRVGRVQPAGRPWASAADHVRGRLLTPGMVLGADDAGT